MSFGDFTELYFLVLLACLISVAGYYHFSNFEVEESDRRLLVRANLNLAVILRLLEAPDTHYLVSESGAGRSLFLEYARSLRTDVLSLVQGRELGIGTYFLLVTFYLATGVLYAKTAVYTQLNDIRMLSGLALRIARSLAT